MPKLRLKPTPAERARRRAARRTRSDHLRAALEEERFREKMSTALEDDERLDGINARFGDYAHIPDRWARDEHDAADPRYMDDDEYAEWIRQGMWKKKHAQEYEEQAQRAAQRAREKEIRAETIRLERLALEREERRARERQKQREDEHRLQYEQRWKALLDSRTRDHRPLSFADIPWPLFPAHSAKRVASDADRPLMEHITPDAVSAFLLPDRGDDLARRHRDKLKETLLRFHPDKFEGRFIHRVPASDVETVREAVGQVARVLNVLLSAQS